MEQFQYELTPHAKIQKNIETAYTINLLQLKRKTIVFKILLINCSKFFEFLFNGNVKKIKNIITGEVGYRSQYLSHAKRALYHLSYIPTYESTSLNQIKHLCGQLPLQCHSLYLMIAAVWRTM